MTYDLAGRPRDHAGLEVLGYEECLRLAGSRPVGRVAFVQDGDVEVLPVNHCVLDGMIAFRTGEGSKFGAAIQGRPVAFEVDDVDEDRRTGWSVLVKGRVEEVLEAGLLDRLRATGVTPWITRVPRPHWLAIRPDVVTGRRI